MSVSISMMRRSPVLLTLLVCSSLVLLVTLSTMYQSNSEPPFSQNPQKGSYEFDYDNPHSIPDLKDKSHAAELEAAFDNAKKSALNEVARRIAETEKETHEPVSVHDRMSQIFQALAKIDNDHLHVKVPYTAYEMEQGPIHPLGEEIVLVSATNFHGLGGEGIMFEQMMENRDAYCKKYNHIHHFVNTSGYDFPHHAVWNKLPALKEAFDTYPKAEWVWWLDTDALIMNFDIELGRDLLSDKAIQHWTTYGRPLGNGHGSYDGEVVPPRGTLDPANIDMIVSQDKYFGLNAGSFFVRRSVFSQIWLDLWDEPLLWDDDNNNGQFRAFREQGVLIYMYLHHEAIRNHTTFFPQRAINSYPINEDDEGKGTINDYWTHHPGDFIMHMAGCTANGWPCERIWERYWAQLHGLPIPPLHDPEEEQTDQEEQKDPEKQTGQEEQEEHHDQ